MGPDSIKSAVLADGQSPGYRSPFQFKCTDYAFRLASVLQ